MKNNKSQFPSNVISLASTRLLEQERRSSRQKEDMCRLDTITLTRFGGFFFAHRAN